MNIQKINTPATRHDATKATPALLTKAELLELIDAVLGRAEAPQGWRLVLVLVEWEPHAWRLACCVPSDAGAWAPGEPPVEWLALGWLTDGPGPSEPVCWRSLDSAATEAHAIRQAGLNSPPRQGRGDELRVVVTDRPRVVVA
ncbi:hypothetical protein [uncultured Thiodictyon sp.]|uniref:hypothetical protein n=1 Tax=uncultured Thiodictyon sp. TaxID=1846217 RepID=UPI0025EA3101|nr:hypothetical protein [uncultured Thiodictyon sp.]